MNIDICAQAQNTHVRGDYKVPIVSDSMAFDPIDAGQHRIDHPGVDLVIDGEVSARPVFTSLSQRRKYQKKRGFVDTADYN